jgi:hypothetical protein
MISKTRYVESKASSGLSSSPPATQATFKVRFFPPATHHIPTPTTPSFADVFLRQKLVLIESESVKRYLGITDEENAEEDFS